MPSGASQVTSLRPAAPANGSRRTGSVMPGAWPMTSARCPSRAHRIGGGIMRGHIRHPAIVWCSSASVRTRTAGWSAIRAYATRPVSTPERISADLVICRLSQLATPGGETGEPLRGAALGDVEVHEGDMWIAAYAGEIVAVGHGYEVRDQIDLDDGAIIIDAPGLVAVPGLIDCHTHSTLRRRSRRRVRAALPRRLLRGDPGERRRHPLDRARDARGRSTTSSSRARAGVLAGMLEHGATTVEIKSGYGLDTETESMMLRAVQEAGYESAAHVMSTCLAAHAVPEGTDADAYIQLCIDEILPEVAEWALAEAADVFCERGAFDADQARRYLEAAREHGLALRLHGDQFAEIGAIDLAIELAARSVDHLEATGPEGVAKLAASDVVGVALPAVGADAGAPDAPGARADRRRRAARARDRLQPRLEPVRLAPDGDAPGLHAGPPARPPRRSPR